MAKSHPSPPKRAKTHLDFRRVALQRAEDAQTLLRAERTTGATYLAGYAVECMLKAMVLSRASAKRRSGLLARFRGRSGHSLESLKAQWIELGGEPFSREVSRAFATIVAWSTDFRYVPGAIQFRTAQEFLVACETILRWADERVPHG